MDIEWPSNNYTFGLSKHPGKNKLNMCVYLAKVSLRIFVSGCCTYFPGPGPTAKVYPDVVRPALTRQRDVRDPHSGGSCDSVKPTYGTFISLCSVSTKPVADTVVRYHNRICVFASGLGDCRLVAGPDGISVKKHELVNAGTLCVDRDAEAGHRDSG